MPETDPTALYRTSVIAALVDFQRRCGNQFMRDIVQAAIVEVSALPLAPQGAAVSSTLPAPPAEDVEIDADILSDDDEEEPFDE